MAVQHQSLCLKAVMLVLISMIVFLPLVVHSDPIHDLLRTNGLPAGLLPKAVRSYTLQDNGRLEVILDRPCLTKFENRVYFDRIVKGNLSYGEVAGLEGLSQEELFLWLPVKNIVVNDPSSRVILFNIGVAHEQLSLSLFEDLPDCESKGQGTISLTSGVLGKESWKQKDLKPKD